MPIAPTARPLPSYRLLGGVSASVDGVDVDLGGPKQRAVLALLLVEFGRSVPSGRLIDAVWAGTPPARAEVSLRGYVSNLRKALGGDADRIAWRDEGYALAADPADVDILQFEQLVADGQAAIRSGQPAEARATLAAALGLWRGPPLGPLAAELPVDDVVARLEARRAEALEALIDARLGLGEHASVIGELTAAVASDPFREGLRARLALALYRAGRAVDALRSLDDARRILAEEVGVEPGPELRRLESAILAHDEELEWRPTDRKPADGRRDGVVPAGVFVGRDTELGILLDAVEGLGRVGRIVVVGGEAGVGKSTLVRRALATSARAAPIAWASCAETAVAAPYRLWKALARQLAEGGASPGLAAALDARHDPRSDSVSGRLRVHASVSEALRSGPACVLVVDDLQWADDSSLALLELLANEVVELPVLLVATVRTPLTDATAALVDCLGEMARTPAFRRLDLGGLPEAAVAAWVDHAVGDRAGEGLAAFVHDRAGGNPFFVEELVALLVAEDRLDADAASASGVPAAVLDVVRRRASRLPPAAQQVLSAAAVLGRTFDADVVAAVVDAPLPSVLDTLTPALDAGLVVVEPSVPARFAFSHALVAETFVAEQNAIRRARLHAAATFALERLRAPGEVPVEELAHHAFAGAAAGSAAAAVGYLVDAAAAAAGSHAHATAAAHLLSALRALELADPGDLRRRQALLAELGLARARAGDVAGARAAVADAAALAEIIGDVPAMIAVLARVNADDFWSSLDWSEHDVRILALIERALAAIGPADSAERAELLAALAAQRYHIDPSDRIDAVSAEAVALAERQDDPMVLARVLVQRYWAMWRPSGNRARAEAADALVALGHRGLLPASLVPVGHLARFAAAYEIGDAEIAERSIRDARDASDPIRTPAAWSYLLYAEVSLLLLRGRFAAAEQLNVELLDAFRRSRKVVAATTHGGLQALIHTERGEIDDAVGELALLESTTYATSLAWLRAWILSEAGRLDEATAALHAFDGPLADDWYRTVVLTAAVHAAVAVGDTAFLSRHVDDLRNLDGYLACAGSGGIVVGPVALALARVSALLGDLAAADAHVAGALDVAVRMGAEPWIARTLAVRAELRGDRADLDEARSIARRLGMRALAGRLDR